MLHILTIASLDWRNGHEYALQAMSLLHAEGLSFRYRIVGSGSFLEAVAFARHDLRLDDYVELCQSDDRQLNEHVHWADLYVCATVSSGAIHGLSAAASAGLPIICTDTTGLLNGLVRSPLSLKIVPRRNSKAIARMISDHFMATISHRHAISGAEALGH